MKALGRLVHCGKDIEGREIDLIAVIGKMCVPKLTVRFAGAIVSAFRRRRCLLDAAVAGYKRENGVLGSADLDAGCFVEQEDCAVSGVNGVDAKAAKEENDEYESDHH